MKNQKHLFNLDEDVHYLNCAYKAPMLKSAEQAISDVLIKVRNPYLLVPGSFFDEVERAKELFGKIINCSASEIAIVPSTSYGFTSALNNIKGKVNGNAVTIENEFPSGHFSLKRWCNENQSEMRVVQPDTNTKLVGENWNKRILDAIDEKTGAVLLSSIHWMTGIKFDLVKIGKKCRAVGAKLIVDGTQSVGAAPMDVKALQLDALVCASYKWLFGPYSIGLAYFGEPFNGGTPLEESWMNRTNASDFSNLTDYDQNYKPNATRYSVGEKSNLITMPMLVEGLKQVNQWTVPVIQDYAGELLQPLLDYLREQGQEQENQQYLSNHLFGLRLPELVNVEALRKNLAERRIYLSVRGDVLRIALHVFNTENDVQQLIEAIESSKR